MSGLTWVENFTKCVICYTHDFWGFFLPCCKAQSVICLTADACLTANPGVLAQSHTFAEIDHEIISMAILLSSADSRRVVVSYKRKYVQEVLVNRLVKLAQEKSMVR